MDYAVDYLNEMNTGGRFVYDDPRYFSKLYVLLKSIGVVVYTATLITCSRPDIYYIFMVGVMSLSTANSARYEYRHYQRYGTIFSSIGEYDTWKQQLWPITRAVFSIAELGIKIAFFIRMFPPRFDVRSMCDVGQSIFNIHIFVVFTIYTISGISCVCFLCSAYCCGDNYPRQQRLQGPQTRFIVIPHQNEECCICLDDSAIQIWVILPCGHTFHNSCITRWLVGNDTCPVCRIRVE